MKPWSRRDLKAVVAAASIWFALIVLAVSDYRSRVLTCGDNRSYAMESAMMRGAATPDAAAVWHLAGYPLMVAPLAALPGSSEAIALPLVSAICSTLAVIFAAVLWGPVVATWFAIIDVDWIQRSLLGGADPSFALFAFAALLQARRGRWTFAALLAAAATVVRPIGLACLLAIAFELTLRRDWRRLAITILSGAGVGACYLLFVGWFFGDPFANVAFYRSWGLGSEQTFVPFVTVWGSLARELITPRNAAKTLFWTAFTLVALTVACWRRRNLLRREGGRLEWVFALLYLGVFLLLPARWVESDSQRYLIPVLPMLFVAVERWLPQDRRVVWPVAILVATVAALKSTPLFEAIVP